MTPYSVVGGYQRFVEPYCFQFQTRSQDGEVRGCAGIAGEIDPEEQV
jgi:hypothetical protein